MPKQRGSTKPKNSEDEWEFRGFVSPTTTPVPDEFFDVLAPRLTEAELRVSLYIIRRTFGFKKNADAISLRQMVDGIRTKDGRVLDQGTGLSKPAVIRAVRSLVQRKVITAIPRRTSDKGFEATTYSLNILQPAVEAHPLLTKLTRGSNLSLPPLVNEDNPQQTVLQETVKQDLDLSNIRKTEKENFDYVNSESTAGKAPKGTSLTHADGIGSSQNQSSSNYQNIEEIEEIEKYRCSAAKLSGNSPPSSTGEPKRGGGLEHIGQTLQDRIPMTPLTDDSEAREAIEDYIRDIAAKLHDEAPLKTSTTRAYNLYIRSGVHLGRFFNALYDAEKEAHRRSASIKKLTALGFKNRMAYFFAVLEDKLGLREKPLPNGPQSR
jgi:hypothetical protein